MRLVRVKGAFDNILGVRDGTFQARKAGQNIREKSRTPATSDNPSLSVDVSIAVVAWKEEDVQEEVLACFSKYIFHAGGPIPRYLRYIYTVRVPVGK